MKIYVGHSTNFDFNNDLYKVLKESELWDKYDFILSHDLSSKPIVV